MYQSGSFRRRQARRNLAAFTTLLGTPSTGNFVLPAGADIFVRAAGAANEGVALGTVGGTSFSSPGMAAGGLQRLGYFERGAQVQPLAGFDIVIDTGLGRYQPISAVV